MIQWFIDRTDLLIKAKLKEDQTDEAKAALEIYRDTKLKFEELKKYGFR